MVIFVDDADLASNGKSKEIMTKNMQEMLNLYDLLYGATGGVIESEKSKYYTWKWN